VLDIADNERCFEAHDAIAGALERRITARISMPTLGVICAVDLNHELLRGRQEIRDEAPELAEMLDEDDEDDED
jgi:hypothetical protein